MRDILQITRELALNLALMGGNPNAAELLEERPFECIARTVYAEARGEGEMGMGLVVQSIINRSQVLSLTPCQIVQRAYDGYRLVRQRNTRSFDQQSWAEARMVSLRVIAGHLDMGDCSDVTHFLNPSAVRRMPSWASRENYICTVGNHRAYAISNI